MKKIKKILWKTLCYVDEYAFSMLMLICLIALYTFGEIDSIMGGKEDIYERFWEI